MLRDLAYLIAQDCQDIWHAVKELFKRDKREVIAMKSLKTCTSCHYRKASENSLPCRECSPENDKWTARDVSADPEELLP